MSYGENDGFAGDMDPDPSYGGWHAGNCGCGSCSYRSEPSYSSPRLTAPIFVFRSEEDLIASPVFQRCLGQALAHKQRQIDSLRQEIMELYYL